jgi:hypothetical protein
MMHATPCMHAPAEVDGGVAGLQRKGACVVGQRALPRAQALKGERAVVQRARVARPRAHRRVVVR